MFKEPLPWQGMETNLARFHAAWHGQFPKLGSQFSTPRYSVQKYNITNRGQECGQQPTCPLQGSKRHTHNSSQIKHFLCTLAHIDSKHTCSSFAYACYDRVMTGVLGIFFVAPRAIRVMAVCQGYPCWLVRAKAGMERPLKLLPYNCCHRACDYRISSGYTVAAVGMHSPTPILEESKLDDMQLSRCAHASSKRKQ